MVTLKEQWQGKNHLKMKVPDTSIMYGYKQSKAAFHEDKAVTQMQEDDNIDEFYVSKGI